MIHLHRTFCNTLQIDNRHANRCCQLNMQLLVVIYHWNHTETEHKSNFSFNLYLIDIGGSSLGCEWNKSIISWFLFILITIYFVIIFFCIFCLRHLKTCITCPLVIYIDKWCILQIQQIISRNASQIVITEMKKNKCNQKLLYTMNILHSTVKSRVKSNKTIVSDIAVV